MRKKNLPLVTLLFAFLMTTCTLNRGKSVNYDDLLRNPVTIKGTRFIDGYGRQILFNGINLVNKNPADKYISPNQKETFKKFKEWGYNVVRLGIIWDGLEPEPGVYNEEYLKEIDKQIKLAADNGMFVFLDMHQDLFSVKFSDGAPAWATLDEGKPHITGAIWSDAYLISPAVQTAWDNFWKNKPVSDGVGVQDHYAKAWQHVAKRYVGNHTVIGYDMMNEPFVGSEAQMFMPIMFGAFAQLIAEETGKEIPMEEIAAMWSDEESRFKALQMVATKERFSKVIDAVYDVNSKFEKESLQPFYQKVADAIRTEDKKKILFFNHSYFCNSGVRTALEPMKTADGSPDPLVAYAAHGYDLVVDTKNLTNFSSARLEFIYERINESGIRMNVPVLIGEWGALGADVPGMSDLAYNNLQLMERFNFNNTYWAYYHNVEKATWFKPLIRPYPAYISGELLSYSYDANSGVFTCQWNETDNQNLPTSLFVPDINRVDIANLSVIPEGNGVVLEPLSEGTGGYITIYPIGKTETREITFTIEKGEEMEISLTSR